MQRAARNPVVIACAAVPEMAVENERGAGHRCHDQFAGMVAGRVGHRFGRRPRLRVCAGHEARGAFVAARLAAIHAFFRYVGARHPDQIERAQRVLGVPFKSGRHRVVEYLEHAEIEAILSRIDRSSQADRQDYALLATMFNTGQAPASRR